jgi:predicted RNase H-like nuclease (RuvC/YqgF family)
MTSALILTHPRFQRRHERDALAAAEAALARLDRSVDSQDALAEALERLAEDIRKLSPA